MIKKISKYFTDPKLLKIVLKIKTVNRIRRFEVY